MNRPERNFSMRTYWERITQDHEPELAFRGATEAEWAEWHAAAHARYMELLGQFPVSIDLDPTVEYSIEDQGLIRERVVLHTEEHMWMPCQVLRPSGMAADGTNAAILCSHGHGPFGKDPVAGIRSSPEMEENIRQHNYNYGEQMARAGYLTICPDLRVFGERRDPTERNCGRDRCNVNFIIGAMLGVYPLTLNIWDMSKCIDYLEARPEVDPSRIGMMGLSQGGTMTTFTTAAEPRIKAADIIGYVNPWREFGVKNENFCGSQIVPSIYRYLDTHDIAGLIAPRPLLLEMGIYDSCFSIEDLLNGYEGVKRIYKAAGVGDRLWADVHSGPHAFAGNKAFEFFAKYL